MTIAFILLTYGVDVPAGMEKSVAALVGGLTHLGHRTYVVAAGPTAPDDPPTVLRLGSLTLGSPLTDEVLLSALRGAAGLDEELGAIVREHEIDVVCWVDALWGLGMRALRPCPARKVLAVHVVGRDLTPLREALRQDPDIVVTPSNWVIEQARRRGIDTRNWRVVPNALLDHNVVPPPHSLRARLRAGAPIRMVARLGREKGILEALTLYPSVGRDLEVVLAEAPFEVSSDDQSRLMKECRSVAARRDNILLRSALPWAAIASFLAGGSLTVVPSVSESFGLVALESMSVGTPVIAFDVGNLRALLGNAGMTVDVGLGCRGLWDAAAVLLSDQQGYVEASSYGVGRAAPYRSDQIAHTWLQTILD